MINKKTVSLTIIFIIASIVILFVIFKNNLSSYIPSTIKSEIKKNILSEELLEKLKSLEKHEEENHSKKHYNELDFPETQFLTLSYRELSLENKIDKNKVLKNYDGKYHSKSNYFLESFDNDVIIASETGSFFFINNKVILNEIDYKLNSIKSNFDKNKIQILDILRVNENLIISYSKSVSDKCFSLNIAKAKFDKNLLEFQNFFETTDCQPKYFAGRLFEYVHKNVKGVLVSVDVWGVTLEDEEKRNLSNMNAQDDNSSFGKILFVNYDGKYDLFSKGHRTPQGLFVTDNNFIISTEHGPRGGDEINLIEYKGNYGWPISSYGELYNNQEPKNEKFFYKKSHSKNNFNEPIFVFLQSIGISQLIKVPKNFSKFWVNNFLITSLNSSSLYRVKFDKNFGKLLYFERIFIGKRIRDIIYIDDLKTFMVSLDEKDGFLGLISVEDY
jgi:hypothetical protein